MIGRRCRSCDTISPVEASRCKNSECCASLFGAPEVDQSQEMQREARPKPDLAPATVATPILAGSSAEAKAQNAVPSGEQATTPGQTKSCFRVAWPWDESTTQERLFVGRVRPTPETVAQRLEASYPDVSRMHAELAAGDGHVVLRDLNSLNGTYLGERRLAPFDAENVAYGQKIRFGTRLEVTILPCD